MKTTSLKLFFILVGIICLPTIVSADCYTTLRQKAIEAYNRGEYDRAKSTFQAAKEDCPDTPSNNDIDSWMQKCDSAKRQQQQKANQGNSTTNPQPSSYLKVNGDTSNSTVYLLNSSSSKIITISCSTSYSIYNIPSWCSITNRTSTSFTLNYQANPNTYTRYGSIDIGGGGTSIRISLEQAAKTTSSSSNTTTSSSSLKVNKSLIVASASGITEYIIVTCNKAWEIQYPSGGMYTATRSGNSVKVVISANTTTSKRTDFFNIRTTDGKETIKVSLSQSPGSSSGSYSSYNSTRNYTYSKYDQYCINHGDFEVTWFGMRAGLCTGISYGYRLFSLRWGPVQINPIEIAADYNFVTDEVAAVYTPSVDFFIPFQGDAAFYFGGGPSIHITDYTYAWADVSAGIHWHWGYSASSDFFVRYNGSFMFGVSIQWSTDY